MSKVKTLNPKTASDKELHSIKLDYVEGVLFTVGALIKDAKRKDGPRIIYHISKELEQIDIATREQGRRDERALHAVKKASEDAQAS